MNHDPEWEIRNIILKETIWKRNGQIEYIMIPIFQDRNIWYLLWD